MSGPTPDMGDSGKMVYAGHQDLLVETPYGSAVTLSLGVPTLWLGIMPSDSSRRLSMCVDGIVALYAECLKMGADFTIWNLPTEEYGECQYQNADEFRIQMESTAGAPMSDELFLSYLLTVAITNAYTQIMDMPRIEATDIKIICAFFRQVTRIVDSGEAPWPEQAGNPSGVYEQMENFLLTMASYPAVSRMPPPEVTGFIKRNYVPTIGALQAILMQTGEEYLITEVVPPCDCPDCQLMASLTNTERMVSQIGQMLQQLMDDLSSDDISEDERHPDDL